MIILSGVLVIAAIALLVTGIVFGNTDTEALGMDGLQLIYVSIVVSVISFLCLAAGVFQRRKEIFGAPAAPAKASSSSAKKPAKKAKKDDAAEVAPVADPAEVPSDATVFVVPGRKRYHLGTCRQLSGREKEELTHEEAREEGFSPCTACLPDSALAARAEPVADAKTGKDAGEDTVTLPAIKTSSKDAKKAKKEESAKAAEASSVKSADSDQADGAEADTGSDAKAEAAGEPESGSEAVTASEAKAEAAGEPESGSKAVTASDDAKAEGASEPESDSKAGSDSKAEGDAGSQAVAGSDAKAVAASEPEDDSKAESGSKADADVVAKGGDEAEAEGGGKKAELGDSDKAKPDEAKAADSDAGDLVRILSGTKRFHRADCALIVDIGEDAEDLETVTRDEAKTRGCTPCLVCQPDKAAVGD